MNEQNNYSEPSPVIQESLQTKEDGEKDKVPESDFENWAL